MKRIIVKEIIAKNRVGILVIMGKRRGTDAYQAHFWRLSAFVSSAFVSKLLRISRIHSGLDSAKYCAKYIEKCYV